MKRYETLSKEEIIEIYSNTDCNKCDLINMCCFKNCMPTKNFYLNQEVNAVSRFSLIKSEDELRKSYNDFSTLCKLSESCNSCDFYKSGGSIPCSKPVAFLNYLCDKIIVEVNDNETL